MKKRIFISMALLTVFSLLVVSIVLCLVFYGQSSRILRSELRETAGVFRDNTAQTAMEAFSQTQSGSTRVTVIAPDGTVAFDSTIPAEKLENHADREEIVSAVKTGEGEISRFSDTLKEETYYYAVRMADGFILRVAKTASSMLGMFAQSLPVVAFVVLFIVFIGYFLAGRLTGRILAPINSADLNAGFSAPYDELAPFAAMIEAQRKEIARQVDDLRGRADTIEAILGNMSEGIVLVGGGGEVLTVNKSAAAFFDVPLPAAGKNILELFRNADVIERLRGALFGRRGEMNLTRNGRTYRAHFSPVTGDGAIMLFMDITEQMRAETLRREFSANVSHELKTPLTTIYGHAEMLFNGMVKEEDKRVFYGHIKDEAGRLIALIEDILLVSRLDEGAGQELLEDVELSAVIAQTVESLSSKAEENGVTFRISCGKAVMKANRSQMYELFYNLVDNAIKYNKPGGTVGVNVTDVGGELTLSVSDTGIGIPKDAQGRVFERFFRVERSRSKKTGGTGLGLAIVKHIALAHRGRIELKSEVGAGTTITIRFQKRGNPES